MNTEEIKKIYLVLNELESAERQLEWEGETKENFEKSNWLEVRLSFSGNNGIVISNLPKEIFRSLLDSYYVNLKTKKLECERFLLVSGINIEDKKNV